MKSIEIFLLFSTWRIPWTEHERRIERVPADWEINIIIIIDVVVLLQPRGETNNNFRSQNIKKRKFTTSSSSPVMNGERARPRGIKKGARLLLTVEQKNEPPFI